MGIEENVVSLALLTWGYIFSLSTETWFVLLFIKRVSSEEGPGIGSGF